MLTTVQPLRAESVNISRFFGNRTEMNHRLTGLKTLFRGKRGAQGRVSSGILTAVAMLCLILLAMLVVAQVTHLHPNQSDADHCQLCIVMHTVVPVAAAAAIIVIVQLGASAPQAEPIVVTRQRQIRLFIRPPPASC